MSSYIEPDSNMAANQYHLMVQNPYHITIADYSADNLHLLIINKALKEMYEDNNCPYCQYRTEKVTEIPTFDYMYNRMLTLPFSIDVFERVNFYIQRRLHNIECLISIFDPCCCSWRLYYGTPSIKDRLPRKYYHHYFTKNRVLRQFLEAANETELRNKRGEPKNNIEPPFICVPDSDDDEPLSSVVPRRKWSNCEILIRRVEDDDGNHTLCVLFNRLNGCREASRFIQNELRTLFAEERFSNAELLLADNEIVIQPRMSYLSFVEGISESVWENKESQHIIKYVANDMLSREFCTFIPYYNYT